MLILVYNMFIDEGETIFHPERKKQKQVCISPRN